MLIYMLIYTYRLICADLKGENYITSQISAAVSFFARWNETGNIMSVTSISNGQLSVGQVIYGDGLILGTTIMSQVSGNVGDIGDYELSSFQGSN